MTDETATPAQVDRMDRHLFDPLATMFGSMSPERRPHYLEALKHVDEPTLQRTFAHLRDHFTHKRFPFPADILGAVRAVSAANPKPKGYTRGPKPEHPWETSRRQQDRLVAEYMRYFVGTQLCEQARAGGYEGDLERFVRAVARVQAQVIAPSGSGLAFDSVTIFGNRQQVTKADEEADRAWFAEQRQQAESGNVSVHVPAWRIRSWMELAASTGRRPSTGRTPEASPPVKTSTPAAPKASAADVF